MTSSFAADQPHQTITDRQASYAWAFLTTLGRIDPTRPLGSAIVSALELVRTDERTAELEDTDETCAECHHSVEDQQHYEGCSVCACSLSLVPDPID